jgi:hypothetical protein
LELQQEIKDFIENPIVLWENQLTQLLVEKKTFELGNSEYNLNKSIIENLSSEEASWPLFTNRQAIRLVKANERIEYFLQEHGLSTLPFDKTDFITIAGKVNAALDVFKNIPSTYNFIMQIVKSIVLIYSENDETDISYSHPDIPFSIFFSLCSDKANFAAIRVAESILHEAMHLKLTLIEQNVPLIKSNSKEVYFSPWREENRPVRGVLHGLFVFRAIFDFYSSLEKELLSVGEQQFLSKRIEEISQEMDKLRGFFESSGLTQSGSKLAKWLLTKNDFYTVGSSGNLHLTQ